MMKCFMITIDTLLFKEEVQIKGISCIMECSNLTLAHTTMWTPSEASNIFTHCEKVIPVRHRKIKLVKLPRPLWFALEFAKHFLSSKMKQRIFLDGNIQDFANVPKNSFSFNEITSSWILELETHQMHLKTLNEIKIDLDKQEVEKAKKSNWILFWR